MILTVFALTFVASTVNCDYGTLQRVSIETSLCENCGMSGFGQVNLKICGGSPELCCSVVNIGDFDSDRFQPGQTDDYTGDYLLQDCYNYKLDKSNAPQDVKVTVYHEGSLDGVMLQNVDLATNLVTLRCPVGEWLADVSSFYAMCYLA